jgi:hypothetical protein
VNHGHISHYIIAFPNLSRPQEVRYQIRRDFVLVTVSVIETFLSDSNLLGVPQVVGTVLHNLTHTLSHS